MASFAAQPDQQLKPVSLEITAEIAEDMLYGIQRLARLASQKESTLEEKKLAWEVIRTIRSELRELRGSVAGADLAAAVRGMLPAVNVQVNVDSAGDRRRMLAQKAENGMTARLRGIAKNQLAKMDAALAGNQTQPIPGQVNDVAVDSEPIEAAEKP